MITKEKILLDLAQMQAPRERVVMVHTSLKSIGQIEGGGETLLDVLITYFTEKGGILCVPTHTWANLNTDLPTLDLCNPMSNLGVFPNIALKDSRGVRTLHPTHSMVVFGEEKAVADFIEGEAEVDTMTSPKGCHGKIYSMDGSVLLVGVGQDKNTYLHCVEEMLGVKNRIAKTPITATIKHKNGTITEKKLYNLLAEGIEDVSVNYPNFEPAFRKHGCIIDGKLGNANVQLCNAIKMKNVMELIHNRCQGAELLYDRTPIPVEWYE